MSLNGKVSALLSSARSGDKEIESYLLHNAGLFYKVQTSFKIADRMPLDVDMRSDVWFRIDRLVVATYYAKFLSKAFAPVPEMTEFLFNLVKCLEKASGAKLTEVTNLGNQPDRWFRDRCNEMETVLELADSKVGSSLSVNTLFKGYGHPVQHFWDWLSKVANSNKPEDVYVGFQYRMKLLPYFLAATIEDLP